MNWWNVPIAKHDRLMQDQKPNNISISNYQPLAFLVTEAFKSYRHCRVSKWLVSSPQNNVNNTDSGNSIQQLTFNVALPTSLWFWFILFIHIPLVVTIKTSAIYSCFFFHCHRYIIIYCKIVVIFYVCGMIYSLELLKSQSVCCETIVCIFVS